uniref:Uncharacterized protein n=1 Tax=Lotus japonicus TaxID=34305 RepID=I3S594_LOTJA|nr:unknown [Lotus japonicus]
MQSMGLGTIADQLGDLKLEELLTTPPPGTDEIVAVSRSCNFLSHQNIICSPDSF